MNSMNNIDTLKLALDALRSTSTLNAEQHLKKRAAVIAIKEALAAPVQDDYKAWYDEAMVASNEAGFSGVSAAETIRELNRMVSTPPAAPVQQKPLFADLIAQHPGLAEELRAMDAAPVQEPVARVWDEGYRAGIDDERTSEANIGIAGMGMKVEPARNNPYRPTPPAVQQETAVVAWDVARLTRLLFDAWSKAEPNHSITKYPESYMASFQDMARAVINTTPPAAQPAPVQEPVLAGRWHHGNGTLCSGSLRIARADFDTNPPIEMQDRVFDDICKAMNASLLAHQSTPAAPVQEPVTKPKLIGWRTADFLNETTDIKQARSWEVHYEVLPIFEGDPNTKLVTPPAAPVQEPVAIVRQKTDAYGGTFIQQYKMLEPNTKLYTTPPAVQRQWIGLTKVEIAELLSTHHMYMEDFVFAVQSMLKEKNT